MEGGGTLTIPKERRGLKVWSRSHRVMGALVDWARELAKGGEADLNAICKKHRISRRVLTKELKSNASLQDEVFGAMAVEAKLTLVRAFQIAHEVMSAQSVEGGPEPNRAQQLAWARFIAQWSGGGFEKKDAPQIAIVNLIPERPKDVVVREIKSETLVELTR